MKNYSLMTSAAIIISSPAFAITVTATDDPFALANTLFLNQPEIIVNGADLNAAALDPLATSSGDQAGTYINLAGTYGLPSGGIVLSSGNVADYETGSNTQTGFTNGYDVEATPAQQDLLFPITGLPNHNDVVQLDIDFFVNADIDQVTFFAAFGSDEFPEFVGGTVTDGFGLYVNGTNVASAVPTGGGTPLAINIDHPDMMDIPGTELDGVLAPNGNPLLRFDVPVSAGEQNEFTIILADAGDDAVDSTVYISSFFADIGGPGAGETEFDPILPSNPPDPLTGEFIIELPEVPPGTTVWLDPPVAVGYEYDFGAGNEVATVSAPSLATVTDLDGYFIEFDGLSIAIGAGETVDLLSAFGQTTTSFKVTGIDPSLMLDPDDPLAFPLGVSFLNLISDGTLASVTPIAIGDDITAPIPLPAAGFLYIFGILGGAVMLRKRNKPA